MTDDHETITVPVEIQLDEIHVAAWETILAAEPDEESATERVGRALAGLSDGKTAIYREARRVEQQREQALAGMMADAESEEHGD